MADSRPRGRPKTLEDKADQNTVQALDRALGLLEVLAGAEGLSLTELAQRSGQAVATVFRALVTLQARGMVELETPGQLWHIGSGAFRVGSAFLRRAKVTERARGPMRALMRDTGETAHLGILAGDAMMFVAQLESEQAIRAFFPPGTLGPMHGTAAGKALLAWLPEERRSAIIAAGGLGRFTSLTIGSPELLERNLAQARARGFAIDDQEHAEGMRGVAAPVFDAQGEVVAALGVSGPAFRLGLSDAARFGGLVVAAADEVTAATGGARP